MPETAPNALLGPSTLRRLAARRIVARRRFTNRHQGANLAGRGGSSTEFSDYRDYSPGDDPRFVDWNVFARLRRPYLKLYRVEEEMHVVVLIDGSGSMATEAKLERAREIAAAFGVLALGGGERLSAWSFHAQAHAPLALRARRGRTGVPHLLRFLDAIEAGGDCPVESGIERILAHHRGRGIALVVSDFLTAGDLTRPLNALHASGLEPLGVQLLGPSELEPDVGRDVRLVDVETGARLDVSSVPELLGIYRDTRDAHTAEIRAMFEGRGGRFFRAASTESVDDIVLREMVRRGWIR